MPEDPFAPSTDPDIPTPTRADLLRLLYDGTERSLLAADKLEPGRSETLWRAARRQWDERHKRAAARRAKEEGKATIGLPLVGGEPEEVPRDDAGFTGTFDDVKPLDDTTTGTRVPGQVAARDNEPLHSIPFANPSERQLRHERMQRDTYIHGHPDPKDVAAEEAEELRYRYELAQERERQRKELESEFAQPKRDDTIPFRAGAIPSDSEPKFTGVGNSPQPEWHKRGDLVLAAVLACVGLVVAIALVILPPTSPRAIIFWLLMMFALLGISELLVARFFDFSRRKTITFLLVPAVLVIAFGWYAWPTPLTPEASKLTGATTPTPALSPLFQVTPTPPPVSTTTPQTPSVRVSPSSAAPTPLKQTSVAEPTQTPDATVSTQPSTPRISQVASVFPSVREGLPYGFRIVLQTSVTISPVQVLVQCSGPIEEATNIVIGSSTKLGSGGAPHGKSSYLFRIDAPPFTPQNPIQIDLFSKAKITCKVVRVD